MNFNHIFEILKNFSNHSIMVVGDLMLDEWILGKVERISPEAPIPVVEVEGESFTPGGGANVANNFKALGSEVKLVGVVGKDEAGERLCNILQKEGIDIRGVFVDPSRPTTHKVRVIAHSQQVVRIDKESKSPVSEELNKKMIDFLKENLSEVESVVVSDYAKGVVGENFINVLKREAKKAGVKVVAGPKPKGIFFFQGIYLIILNLQEASLALNQEIDLNNLQKSGENLLKELNIDALIITLGKDGLSAFTKESFFFMPPFTSQVYDVTGAGDTVLAVAVNSLLSGANCEEAAFIANCAAGEVVRKLGTATINVQGIRKALESLNGVSTSRLYKSKVLFY